jgi:hypothetical protein
MHASFSRAMAGGALGTLAMTFVGLYAAPLMGMPPMNPADMLASQMGGSAVLGWVGHLMIGIVLAVIYAAVAASRLPGPAAARGAVFSLGPWVMAQVLVMPMMGMGLFSSSATMATGSLIGHLVYGAVLGGVAGAPTGVRVDQTSHSPIASATR